MELTIGLLGIDIAILFWSIVISTIVSVFAGTRNLIVQSLTIGSPVATPGSANVIELKGRREGLVAFVLTIFGLSPTTSLVVNQREALCTSSGLFGTTSQSLPLDRVPQVSSGSRKPVEYIVVAAIVGFIGFVTLATALFQFRLPDMFGAVIVTTIFVGVLLLLYWIKRRFFLGIYAQGGTPILLSFKPNVIEGVSLDLERAMVLASAVRTLVVSAMQSAHRHESEPLMEPTGSFGTVPADGPHGPSARELLAMAQDRNKSGSRDDAVALLRRVIKGFPTSPEADQARRALERAGISS